MSAVIFDFDFTLADSSKGIVECYEYALKNCGLPVPEKQDICATIGMCLDESFARLSPGNDCERMKVLFKEHADRIMADSVQLFEGVPKIIGELKERGYKIGIVSTKADNHITEALARDGVMHLFDLVIGGRDVANYKPNPEGLLKAISILGSKKVDVIYVGDTLIDLKAAIAAGVKFIGVSTGTTSREEMIEHGAPQVADNLEELFEIITKAESEK